MSAVEGLRVLVTRTREDNAEWARRLSALGAEVVELACIETEAVPAQNELARALPDADWVAFTSRRGVDAFADALESSRLAHARVRVACVGEATAARARERLGSCDFVAKGGTARALGDELSAAQPRARALLALAEDARSELQETLEAAGWRVDRVAVYRTMGAAARSPKLAPKVELALLASPSAVNGLRALAELPATARVVTIGPTTTAAARAAGYEVHAEARSRDLQGMLDALATSPFEERKAK